MAKLAIKGHPKRGNEVIEILEMLGGSNPHNYCADCDSLCFTIGKGTNIIYFDWVKECYEDEDTLVFTLEEFLKKFPYKVDDCVVNHKHGKGRITQMLWIDNEIVYEIHFEGCMAYCKANELCKYDAFKGLLLQELTEYLSHATREELDKTMEEIEIALAPFKVGDKVIVKGYEKMGEDEIICVFKTYDGDIKYKTKNHLDTHYFMEDSLTRVEKSNKEENMRKRTKIVDLNPKLVGERKVKLVNPHDWEIKEENGEIFLQDKRSQYPKNYEECCKVLGFRLGDNIDNLEGYKSNLLEQLQILLICRDAYWKIANNWKPDWKSETENKFTIVTDENEICSGLTIQCNAILAFPTEEMKDAFYENFRELIEQCKELL